MSHTVWPIASDVVGIAAAMNQTMGSSISATVIGQVRDSVIETIKRRTHRIFEPTNDTKYYNGNGKGEIEIDEALTISTVVISGWYGNSSGLVMSNTYLVDRDSFPQTRLQIFRGSVPTLGQHYVNAFPVGRSNIEITALWGYDSTIPNDLWLGAAYQMTGILLNLKAYQAAGYLIKWEEADVLEVRNRMDPFEYFKQGLNWKELMKFYKKPGNYFMKKQAKPLV